ncbi:MAG: copper chaperone PCu(A)C [Burkholderiales bacterium]|nr:copper chaperone PCu(A)C [Sulfuricellaceae bacterium]
MHIGKSALLVLVSLLPTLSAAWAGNAADSLAVQEPYVLAVPPGVGNTAAYMVLKNPSAAQHTLTKASSPAARVTELHTHMHVNGMMEMRPVKQIDIPAKGETSLQPGGLHVMLIGLKIPLKEGDAVPLTLTFEDGSSKRIDAPVKKAGMTMAPMQDHLHQ